MILLIIIAIIVAVLYFDIYVTFKEDYFIIWFNTFSGERNFIKIKKIWKE